MNAHFGNQTRPRTKQPSNFGMNSQIRVPLPVPLLRVGESRVPNDLSVYDFLLAVRQGAKRFGEHLHRVDPYGDFTSSRAEERTRHSDHVADVEKLQCRVALFAQVVFSKVELDASARVCEVRKGSLSM